MNDYLISVIRTAIPAGVGGALAWLATLGVDLAPSDTTALVTGATALVTAIYYGAVRALETRWPVAGYLLGTRKPPTYDKTD